VWLFGRSSDAEKRSSREDSRDRREHRSDRDRDRDRSDRDRRRSSRSRSPDRDRDRRRRRDSRSRSRSPGSRRDRGDRSDRDRNRDRDRRDRDRDDRDSRDHRGGDAPAAASDASASDAYLQQTRRELEVLERQSRDMKRKEDLVTQAQEREKDRRKKEIEDLTRDQRTVFVSQLTMKVKESDLEDFFGQIGKVNTVTMIRDKYTNKHKGFAYVEMAQLEDVPNCLVFNNVVPNFQKFPIAVKASEAEKNFVAKKESAAGVNEQGPDCRIYVGNIHVSVSELMLRELLEQYGEVESVVIHKDETGSSKGYAFARFRTFESATKAMRELGGQSLMGRQLKVGYVNDGQQLQASGGYGNAPTGAGMNNSFSTGTAVSNWKLEDDDGSSFAQMNASSRAMLMAKLGQSAGISVPVPIPGGGGPSHYGPGAGGAPAPVAAVKQQVVPPISGAPSQYFVISNMFNLEQEQSSGEAAWATEIEEDVRDETSRYGVVTVCMVERRLPGGFVYMGFESKDSACKAAASLHGRYFAGKLITVSFVDAGQFNSLINN
jgi:RNA-binding protein 39